MDDDWERWRRYCCKVARSFGVPEMWEEDAIQEAMLAVWKGEKPAKWAARDGIKSFMHSALRPAGLLRHRCDRGGTVEVVRPLSVEGLHEAGFDIGVDGLQDGAVRRLEVEMVLAGLDALTARSLWLCGLGYSAKESAVLLGVSQGVVERGVGRGRVALRAERCAASDAR